MLKIFNKKSNFYLFLGFLLALGAPLGYMMLDYFILDVHHASHIYNFENEFEHHFFTLCYLTFPTMIVFSIFGYFLGYRQDIIKQQHDQMDMFMQVLAHDIRSPLSIVKTSIDVILEQRMGPLTVPQGKQLVVMQRQLKLVFDLCSEFLDVSRMEAGRGSFEFLKINLYNCLQKSIDETSELFNQANVMPQLILANNEIAWINGDDFRLRQVFRNILANASRYVQQNGVVKITINILKNNKVAIEFFNQGPHIAPEYLSKIFDKFMQAKNRENKLGVGLGLVICKNIVEAHQGAIQAKNVENGVCFTVFLPVVLI